jgi:hypothetical protein
VVHSGPPDQLCASERRVQSLEHCLSATCGIKARPAPNLQNRKWLNFQDKIDRKSKVSKLNDVETVETVEAAEATRNGYEEREAVTLDQHIGIRSIQRHCDHGLKLLEIDFFSHWPAFYYNRQAIRTI